MFGLSGLLKTSAGRGKHYYEKLTDGQKLLYKSLSPGIESLAGEIKLPLRPLNEISLVLNCILLDNPMIFYVTSFNMLSDLHKQKCIVRPEYKYSPSLIKQSLATVLKYMQVFDVVKSRSDIDKEIFVHDFCLNNYTYDYSFNDYSFSVLGPVFNKTAVCDGISKFVKLSLDYLGVYSLVVHGKAKNPANANDDVMERHAWNIVEIEGKTYHLDVTFDLSLKDKVNRYDYFNLADQDIKKEHSIVGRVPECATVGNDYFSVNSMVAYSPVELDKFIEKGLMHGKKNIVVKLKNVKDTETIVAKVLSLAQQQYGRIYKCSGMVEVKYNSSQLVFEISFM